MNDTEERERRIVTVGVLLPYAEDIVAALRVSGVTDLRAAVAALLADPTASPLRTARAVATLDDPEMVERALAQAFSTVLALL
jgi:hypothetical protein